MSEEVKIALLFLYAYLVGSIPMAYLFGRILKGIDLREYGSGNVGTSNAWVHVAKWVIFPVGLFDTVVKGSSPLWIARYILGLGPEVQAAAGLLAMAGHNWSPYMGFRGGRGIGPAAGVMFGLYPPRFPLEMFAFAVVGTSGWLIFRNSALWVLISLALLPVGSILWSRPLPIVLLMVALLSLTAIKRMTSNRGMLKVGGNSRKQVLLNRLLYDRDVRNREEWVYRKPPPPQGGG